MPETNFRALCEQLMELAEGKRYDGSAVIAKARAALAQPEPVAPTDEEIEQWADACEEAPLEELDPEIYGWRRCFTAQEFSETIRAAIARWGTSANNTSEGD